MKAAILLAIALGCCFRFYNLEQKFYWFDEAFTSLRISGYTEAELIDWLNQPSPVSVAELLQTFQLPNPQKSLWDTVRSLAAEEPQHPPLYFAIARLWLQGWGQFGLAGSISVIRSLSTVFSLLAIPLIYWLSKLLFGSERVAWIAAALLAVSPFQVLYAQEAREYSLWIVMVLLTSALLLAAMRDGTRLGWGFYAIGLGLSLYTFPSTLLVILSHGLYVGSIANFKLTQPVRSYWVASLLGLSTFIPWLIVTIAGLNQVNQTFVRTERVSLLHLLAGWAVNLCRLFLDYADYEREIKYVGFAQPLAYFVYALFVLCVCVVVAYSFYWLYRQRIYDQRTKQSGLFIFLLSAVPSLPIAFINLFWSGNQSLVVRYLMPSVLGIELSLAFLLSRQLAALPRSRQIWQSIFMLILVGGLVSCAASSQAHFWWTKSRSDMNYLAAPAINQSDRPLLISDAPMGRLLAFAHRLSPEVALQLQPSCFSCVDRLAISSASDLTKIDPAYKTVFLYNPSQQLLNHFQQRIIPVYLDPVHPEQQIIRLEQQ